jgi:hypothetical protein
MIQIVCNTHLCAEGMVVASYYKLAASVESEQELVSVVLELDPGLCNYHLTVCMEAHRRSHSSIDWCYFCRFPSHSSHRNGNQQLAVLVEEELVSVFWGSEQGLGSESRVVFYSVRLPACTEVHHRSRSSIRLDRCFYCRSQRHN